MKKGNGKIREGVKKNDINRTGEECGRRKKGVMAKHTAHRW